MKKTRFILTIYALVCISLSSFGQGKISLKQYSGNRNIFRDHKSSIVSTGYQIFKNGIDETMALRNGLSFTMYYPKNKTFTYIELLHFLQNQNTSSLDEGTYFLNFNVDRLQSFGLAFGHGKTMFDKKDLSIDLGYRYQYDYIPKYESTRIDVYKENTNIYNTTIQHFAEVHYISVGCRIEIAYQIKKLVFGMHFDSSLYFSYQPNNHYNSYQTKNDIGLSDISKSHYRKQTTFNQALLQPGFSIGLML